MSIAQLSPVSVQGNPSHVNPAVQAYKDSTPVQAAHTAQKAAQATKTDTITISSQALQLANSNAAIEKEANKSAP